MDFADPDLFPRFEWHPAGKSAQFTRHRLYRWAAVQQSVSVLYGLVSAIACSTPRGGRDERRGAGGGGTGKNGTRSPPSRSSSPLPASRPLPRAGMAASNAKPSNTKASHTTKAAAPKLAKTRKAVPAATATVIPEKTLEKTAPGFRSRSANWKAPTGWSLPREPPSPRRRPRRAPN